MKEFDLSHQYLPAFSKFAADASAYSTPVRPKKPYKASELATYFLGKREYPLDYLSGEYDEYRKELEDSNKEGIEEELQDVMFAAQMLAYHRTGQDRRVVGADGKIKVFIDRVDNFKRMFDERGVPFSVDYLAGGSNYKKPEKIVRAFEKAGSPITMQEAADLSARYTGMQKTAMTELDKEANKADTNPTEAQTESGNYKKGHVRLHGFDISIENPKGSTRSGTDSHGKAWSVVMPAHYGYIRGTEGTDGDHLDVYIGPNQESEHVFIVDQIDIDTKKFDEHKIIFGCKTQEQAEKLYDSGFSDKKGSQRRAAITPITLKTLKAWAYSSRKKEAFAVPAEKIEKKACMLFLASPFEMRKTAAGPVYSPPDYYGKATGPMYSLPDFYGKAKEDLLAGKPYKPGSSKFDRTRVGPDGRVIQFTSDPKLAAADKKSDEAARRMNVLNTHTNAPAVVTPPADPADPADSEGEEDTPADEKKPYNWKAPAIGGLMAAPLTAYLGYRLAKLKGWNPVLGGVVGGVGGAAVGAGIGHVVS